MVDGDKLVKMMRSLNTVGGGEATVVWWNPSTGWYRWIMDRCGSSPLTRRRPAKHTVYTRDVEAGV